MQRILLVTDVDGTVLTDDDAAVARFAAWRRRRKAQFVLAYASGRFYESVAASVRDTRLPAPDFILGGVGAELRCFPSGAPFTDWEASCETWRPGEVRAALADVPRLELQSDEFQSPRKISYFFHNADDDDLAALAARLHARRIAADLVYSSARDLDVLPRGTNKGAAAARLAAALGVRRVIACGNSGNDASLMRREFSGVVVGDALPELKALIGAHIYHARRPAADGVLEGIRYWQTADRRRRQNARDRAYS
jgi:sucrose-6F-phosphate phosphohydrolase